jgi:RHS repeat-associated protein
MTRRYNVAGQLVQQVEKDNRGELISQFDFSYDAAGNILKEQKLPKPESVSLLPVTMTYSVANRLATYNGQAVQFDADGNMVSGPLSGKMANFSFDSRNRLIQAGETSYRYDAENQRLGVNQTSYVINSQPALSQVLVKEENGKKTFYVYGLGLLGEERAGEYLVYHFDFRGSTVALSNNAGKVVERFQYGPYGELVKGEVSVTPFLFNGKYGVMTEGNGLYYMRARFYSAAMKRFVNMDVLVGSMSEGQTLNRYAFVTGEPISSVDPFGLRTAVVVNGPTDKNPFGHVAIAITDKGVYSYGTHTSGDLDLGVSLTAYTVAMASRRNSDIIIINTTPKQEKLIMEYLKKQPKKLSRLPWFLLKIGLAKIMPFNPWDSCATRVSGALEAAGLLDPYTVGPAFPFDVEAQAELWKQILGGEDILIPKPTKANAIPPILEEFNLK